jgi:hypothetical protein
MVPANGATSQARTLRTPFTARPAEALPESVAEAPQLQAGEAWGGEKVWLMGYESPLQPAGPAVL